MSVASCDTNRLSKSRRSRAIHRAVGDACVTECNKTDHRGHEVPELKKRQKFRRFSFDYSLLQLAQIRGQGLICQYFQDVLKPNCFSSRLSQAAK